MRLLPAAIGIILSQDRTKILLVKRADVPLWTLPGGGIESGETAESALIREVEEETGIKVDILRTCAEYTPLNNLASHTTVFIGVVQNGHPRLSDEIAAVDFFPLSQLPSTFFYVHKQWLQECIHSSSLIKRPLKEISYYHLLAYFVYHPYLTIRYLWTRIRLKKEKL